MDEDLRQVGEMGCNSIGSRTKESFPVNSARCFIVLFQSVAGAGSQPTCGFDVCMSLSHAHLSFAIL